MMNKFLDEPRVSVLQLSFLQSNRKLGQKLGMIHIREDVSKFFYNIVKTTVEYREKYSISRNDFLNMLIQMKNYGRLENEFLGKITLDEIAAQSFIFFLGGFETSSTALTYCLYELSKNQEVQEKARSNVNKILKKFDGKFNYDALMEMNYVEHCVLESLRKYPPIAALTRICEEDYEMEGSNLWIRKDQKVIIPIKAIHWDEEYYPNPEVFDPDRFSADKNPSTFLSFGQGEFSYFASFFIILYNSY